MSMLLTPSVPLKDRQCRMINSECLFCLCRQLRHCPDPCLSPAGALCLRCCAEWMLLYVLCRRSSLLPASPFVAMNLCRIDMVLSSILTLVSSLHVNFGTQDTSNNQTSSPENRSQYGTGSKHLPETPSPRWLTPFHMQTNRIQNCC